MKQDRVTASIKLILAAIAAGSGLALLAHARESQLKGEGSFSAGLNTGNTETSDLGIGVKMRHENQIWRNGVEVIADYGTKMAPRPGTGCSLRVSQTAH